MTGLCHTLPFVLSSAPQRVTQKLSSRRHRTPNRHSFRWIRKYLAKSQKSATRTLGGRVAQWLHGPTSKIASRFFQIRASAPASSNKAFAWQYFRPNGMPVCATVVAVGHDLCSLSKRINDLLHRTGPRLQFHTPKGKAGTGINHIGTFYWQTEPENWWCKRRGASRCIYHC